MSIESFVLNTLKNDEAVKAITGNIYSMLIPQGFKPPMISFQRISTRFYNTLCVDEEPANSARVQVDCWALGYDQCAALYIAVRRALLKAGAEVIGRNDSVDTATQFFRVSADFRIMEDLI